MVAAAIIRAERTGQLVGQIADHHHLVAMLRQRHQGARKLEAGALAGRCPVAHHGAMGNVAIG